MSLSSTLQAKNDARLKGNAASREPFTKVCRIGTKETYNGRRYSVFIAIEWNGVRLATTGVEGPTRGGNCLGFCGQIRDHLAPIVNYAPGWNEKSVAKLHTIWSNWHLNDMQAGTPEQTAALKEFYATREYPENDYTHACKFLEELGLLYVADPRPDHAGKMYKYGSAWLSVEVPTEILETLQAFPDTDIQPAWI